MPLHIRLGYHHNGAVFIYFVSLLSLTNIQAAVQSALQTSFLSNCVAFLYLKLKSVTFIQIMYGNYQEEQGMG